MCIKNRIFLPVDGHYGRQIFLFSIFFSYPRVALPLTRKTQKSWLMWCNYGQRYDDFREKNRKIPKNVDFWTSGGGGRGSRVN